MLTQKQWRIQYLTEHMLSTATSAAAEAATRSAQRQPMVREHAVVAEEIRNISIRIMEALEKNIFGGLSDNEFDNLVFNMSRISGCLALNAALVALKVREHKALAVFADELRNFSLELGKSDSKERKYADIPSISPRSKVIPDVFYLFYATSGNYMWWENAYFVQEVLNYCPEYIQNKRLIIKNSWRDLDVPIIQIGDVPEDAGIVIISDILDPQKKYAVVATFGLHSLSNSHVGINKPCTSDIPVRECWSASDGSEIIFPDWDKMTS